MLMPYSADFALAGPMAKEFANWNSGHWSTNREQAAKYYEERTGIYSVAVYEGDEITISGEKIQFESKNYHRVSLKEMAEMLYSPIPNPRNLFPPVDLQSIPDMVDQATKHMIKYMKRFKLSSDWILKIDLYDKDWQPIYVDLKEQIVRHEPTEGRNQLTCRCEANYFVSLMK